uniref:tRNA N6-adenosine threonylcarbamoyltransferase n=1 Tax=candidate division WOR-3 bacterium TaxID=2052148 RepID=A0A7C4XA13_UNCW3
MITLGIETSCDETGIGIVRDGKVLANVVSSQIVHTRFGGVVPELAARNHIKIVLPLTKLALEIANIKLQDIDLIAATRGPGLIGSILTGLSYAKSLSLGLKKPFIGINHLEGHIYALQFGGQKINYPYLVLIVSGGHTEIVLVEREFKYRTLGRTLDDACGEAFDKVAKMLGLPYPGGPYIEEVAKKAKSKGVRFPIPRPKGFNFSYAGLKTAVLYYIRENPRYNINEVARGFQESALDHLTEVVERVLQSSKIKIKSLGIVGGVSANRRLAEKFYNFSKKKRIKLFIPDLQFCTDNGAMIALIGEKRFKKLGASPLSIDAVSREELENVSASGASF